MWRPPEQILADLMSGEPDRITIGLRDTVEAMEEFDEFPLPDLGPTLLAPFVPSPPDDVQRMLGRVLKRYRSFDPPMAPADRLTRLLDLALAWANPGIATETARRAKIADDPVAATSQIMNDLTKRDLSSDSARLGGSRVVEYLLDGAAPVRACAIEGLRQHRDHFAAIIDWLRPALTDAELHQIAG